MKAGDHVVAAKALFGSCRYIVEDLLPRFGVTSTLVDGDDLDQWRAAMRPETKTLFLESPTNPTLELVDIAAVADIAHAGGATLVVDNVFATPLLQSPLALGADCVVYSATKHIDGQGRCLGGVILASQNFIDTHVHNLLRQTGPALSPFNAWVLLKGLETLQVRVSAQVTAAARIADTLARHPAILKVLYPGRSDHPQAELARRQMKGGGTLVTFEVAGGKAGAFRAANALEIIGISNNLGDAKSLITHPATTTHQRLSEEVRAGLGISEGMLRLSVGLEDVDDLIEDLDRALDLVESLNPESCRGRVNMEVTPGRCSGIVRVPPTPGVPMYAAVTRDIQITVIPEFLADRSEPKEGRFFWAYTIEIANLGRDTVQLDGRHWVITGRRRQGRHRERPRGRGPATRAEPGRHVPLYVGLPFDHGVGRHVRPLPYDRPVR